MAKGNPLSGHSWHFEYHTVDKKKDKAADCVYLSKDRICHHKKCPQYLAKCFVASCCSFRVKEKEISTTTPIKNNNVPTKTKEQGRLYRCILPSNCEVTSKTYGVGKYVSYDRVGGIISVEFKDKIANFMYPDAIVKKQISVPEPIYKMVMEDTEKFTKR